MSFCGTCRPRWTSLILILPAVAIASTVLFICSYTIHKTLVDRCARDLSVNNAQLQSTATLHTWSYLSECHHYTPLFNSTKALQHHDRLLFRANLRSPSGTEASKPVFLGQFLEADPAYSSFSLIHPHIFAPIVHAAGPLSLGNERRR